MKYNKGFAPLILLAIIAGALVVGGGAYYLGKSSEGTKEEPNIQEKKNLKPILSNIDCGTNDKWIKLISPTEGESFKVGEKVTVKWKYCNIDSSNEKVNATILITKHKTNPENVNFDSERFEKYLNFDLGKNSEEGSFIIPSIPSKIDKFDLIKQKVSEVPLGDINDYSITLSIEPSPSVQTGFTLAGPINASDSVKIKILP